MNQDDPFSDDSDDQTVIRPSPGGRHHPRRAHAETEPRAAPFQKALPRIQPDRNRVLTAAFSILSLVNHLASTLNHDDVEGLRTQVIQEIRDFESYALQLGVQHDQVQTARYALCTLVDEVVLNTPWGSHSDWSHNSLLISFHQEAWGGEKFFQYLDQLVRQPAVNLDVLELFYYCLSLGFEGKYRVHESGTSKLDQLRQNLYVLIQRQKGEYEQQLSIHWEGLRDRRNPLIRYVPLWVVGAVAGVLLTLTYLGFNFLINRGSDGLLRELYAMGREKASWLVLSPPDSSYSRLKELQVFLEPEINQSKLVVFENTEGIVVSIHQLFDSGKDRLKKGYRRLLERIARGLREEEKIIIAGYTDDTPIFTRRFPSNWHLSQARAKAVSAVIGNTGPFDGRLSYEGRADNQPIAANNTPENRALNRRVEIIIKHAQ